MFNEKYFNVDDHIVYKVDKDAGVVIAYVFVDFAAKATSELVSDTTYYDLCNDTSMEKVMGIARLKDGDTYNEEAGKRIARLKLLRTLNKRQTEMYEVLRDEMEQNVQMLNNRIKKRGIVLDHLNTYIKRECEFPYGENK